MTSKALSYSVRKVWYGSGYTEIYDFPSIEEARKSFYSQKPTTEFYFELTETIDNKVAVLSVRSKKR